MPTIPDAKPLISESSTSEATTVEVVMNDLNADLLQIPDYQRDSDQWDMVTKSLLVESIINNLSIPAFFFEVEIAELGEINKVVDGQQRLTTLSDFYNNRFSLVPSDEAPYLSPHSVSYAGKTYRELPIAFQNAFKKYRLTVIKLRNLANMRLEIFRRINQGGTPLSGQDIRLAYYGEKSPSLALIRLAGVSKKDSPAAQRFINSAKSQYGFEYPWTDDPALEVWKDWWEDKEIARGQTQSESFLWSLVSAEVSELNSVLSNSAALQKLNVQATSLTIDVALDAYCAQLKWQDWNVGTHNVLLDVDGIKAFFEHYQKWIGVILSEKGPNIPVTKHRLVSAVIGIAYKQEVDIDKITPEQWTSIIEFIRRPQEIGNKLGHPWPASKGRWDGAKGYKTQFETASMIIKKILS